MAKYVRSLAVDAPRQQGPTVIENFQTSVWAGHIAAYHGHMQAHYEKLLSELRTDLPPMPSALEAELRACEEEIRQIRHKPDLDLYSETAPHLRPGAPKPKPSANTGDGDQSY